MKPLKTVYEALRSIGVDALISIGGDDTLKTANKFKLYQEKLPPDAPRIPVVHLPKTIDNDYRGIDFTFGYFTAVDFLGREVRNLIADAEANRAYFLVESMGRSAGWLAYGVAIAGEASLVISVEDIEGPYAATEEVKHPKTGQVSKRKIMNVDKVIKRIVLTMTTREREGKEYGVIVIAEGLAELLAGEVLGRHRPRRARPHQHRRRQLARHFQGPDLEGIHGANRQEAEDHRAAAGLRIALRQAARVRRDARLPARRRRVSGAGGEGPQRRDGFRLRPVAAALRAVRGAGRPEHARDGRSPHRSRTATSTS